MGEPICSGAEEGRGPPGSGLLGGRWQVLVVTRQEGRCVLSGGRRLCGQLPAQGGPGQPCHLSCDVRLPAALGASAGAPSRGRAQAPEARLGARPGPSITSQGGSDSTLRPQRSFNPSPRATTVRYKGRNLRIKAPMCRALKKLCDPDGTSDAAPLGWARPGVEGPFPLGRLTGRLRLVISSLSWKHPMVSRGGRAWVIHSWTAAPGTVVCPLRHLIQL